MHSATTKPPQTPYNLRPRRPTSLDPRSTPAPARAPSPTLTRRRSRPALLRQASSTSSSGTGVMSGNSRVANGARKRKGSAVKSNGANGVAIPNGITSPLEEEHPATSNVPPTNGVNAPLSDPSKKTVPRKPMRPRANSLSMEHWKTLNLELPRKTLHSSIGPLTLVLYFSWPEDQSLMPIIQAVFGLMCIILLGDLLRFQIPWVRQIWEKQLGKFMRESEKTQINGTVWYCLGAITCLYFYPRDIAVASILILSWCDTAASVFGRLISSSSRLSPYSPLLPNPLFGYIPIARKKSLGGTFAGGIVGVAIALGMFGPGWGCAFVGIIAGLAEAVDVGGLDDNLTLPVLSGAMMWLVRVTTGLI
ncbi:hypothetical protein CALCODRAFT_81624 [Calocera cornea HHB12733]|uniref:Phosphatidate cytidylyltransferase n=1 Tax=Calocera cornea HHB12733 TaxID=1353952 RepID=A0A165DDU2_9BASI|nr:hypothetical protein CALCODRAFT_81624 [Calocera cornea HHB12733]